MEHGAHRVALHDVAEGAALRLRERRLAAVLLVAPVGRRALEPRVAPLEVKVAVEVDAVRRPRAAAAAAQPILALHPAAFRALLLIPRPSIGVEVGQEQEPPARQQHIDPRLARLGHVQQRADEVQQAREGRGLARVQQRRVQQRRPLVCVTGRAVAAHEVASDTHELDRAALTRCAHTERRARPPWMRQRDPSQLRVRFGGAQVARNGATRRLAGVSTLQLQSWRRLREHTSI